MLQSRRGTFQSLSMNENASMKIIETVDQYNGREIDVSMPTLIEIMQSNIFRFSIGKCERIFLVMLH